MGAQVLAGRGGEQVLRLDKWWLEEEGGIRGRRGAGGCVAPVYEGRLHGAHAPTAPHQHEHSAARERPRTAQHADAAAGCA